MRQDEEDPNQQRLTLTIDMRIASSWRAADVIAWKKSSFATWSLRFMSQTARRAGLNLFFTHEATGTPTEDDNYEKRFLLAQADAMLLSALPEEKLHHVINIEDLHGSPRPYAKWQALKTSTTPGTYAGRQTARNKVRGIIMGSSTVEEYNSKLESLILSYNLQAKDEADRIGGEEKLHIFLKGLSPTLAHVRQHVKAEKSLRPDKTNLSWAVAYASQEEEEQNLNKKIGLHARPGPHGPTSSSTEACRNWKKGTCKRGSSCNYQHVGKSGTNVQPQKTSKPTAACRLFQAGKCRYGRSASISTASLQAHVERHNPNPAHLLPR